MDIRTNKLHREISTFDAHRAELVESHRNEYVLIKGERVIGFFPTEAEGLQAGYQHFPDEPFLLRKVEESTTPVLFTSL